MKKFLVLSLATLSFSALAGLDATLNLKGVVAPILDISIAQETAATNLDLSQATPALGVKVGTLTEKSNYAQGYTIRATSVHAGKLVNTVDANSSVPYSLSYNGSDIGLNTTPTLVYSTASLKGTFTKELRITYSAPVNLSAGSHEDTVQFTIEAN